MWSFVMRNIACCCNHLSSQAGQRCMLLCQNGLKQKGDHLAILSVIKNENEI